MARDVASSTPCHGHDRCQLNGAEAFSCVASLPLKKRLDILLESANVARKPVYSGAVTDAAKVSISYGLRK